MYALGTEMAHKHLLLFAIAVCLIIPGLSTTTAAKKKTQVKNNSGVTPAAECGETWVKEADGGSFTSPNYPEKYPADRECVYIIEASPRQCIDLFFDENYSIEASWDCQFDHIEVRDGPFVFSTIIGRYCGRESPLYVRSTGRYLYIKFVADSELEATGFSARYNFTQDPDFKHLGEVPPLPLCDFELSGPEGIIDSVQIGQVNPALQKDAVDCRWYIRAPPKARVYLRFLEYEMHNSNDCKRNFVAIYDGSSSVEHLRNKFCSTVANDVMLDTSVAVVRLWADEGSRRSRAKILFTTFQSPPCDSDTFFCHSNMCINTTLVCNGIQNCVYPWDENNCKLKSKPSVLDSLDHTDLTFIGVSCGLTVIMLIIACIIQIKQPRKKYIIQRDAFDAGPLHPDFDDPPHYELCALGRPPGDLAADAAMASDFEKFQKLRRSSSKCIRDHHCGSQHEGMHGGSMHGGSMHGSVRGSMHGSRSNLSVRETVIQADGGPPAALASQHTTPAGPRSILVMKHSYSQDGVNGCEPEEDDEEDDDDDDLMLDDGPASSHHHPGLSSSGTDVTSDHF